jgi:hypothetical protein
MSSTYTRQLSHPLGSGFPSIAYPQKPLMHSFTKKKHESQIFGHLHLQYFLGQSLPVWLSGDNIWSSKPQISITQMEETGMAPIQNKIALLQNGQKGCTQNCHEVFEFQDDQANGPEVAEET